MTCERCANEATHRVTEMVAGQVVTRHLCAACASKVAPDTPGSTVIRAEGTVPAEALRCSRCGAPTAVLVFSGEAPCVEAGTRRFARRTALCAACAATDGIRYAPPPAGHVAVVIA
jgi:hypothetical protein